MSSGGDVQKVDVVVVGAGPAGSAAARRCAVSGLDTVLCEKMRLPRDKVCSGLIVGLAAQRLVRWEFGEIPLEVLADPYHYSGIVIYVSGTAPSVIEHRMPTGWRREIDFWMTEKAREAGAMIRDGCCMKHLEVEGDRVRVTFSGGGKDTSVLASHVIGADGVHSAVRRSLFPELKARFQQEIRECFDGAFPLDRNYYHAFYTPGKSWFDIHHKGPHFCLEVSARPGEIKERLGQVKDFLFREFRFDPRTLPLWRDASMEPRIHENLIDGSFRPAKGRVLLTGDAAGFQLPTSEGIGTALLSGVMAADTVVEAEKRGEEAAPSYLQRVSLIIETIERQLAAANNSRYKETGWDLQEVAEGICSLMTRAIFDDTFSL
jgi:flavin-dependent dehydrogenase